MRVVLDGLASGRDLDEIAGDLRRVWDEPSGFPGDVLLGLAAEAFLAVGATPRQPLPIDRIDERFLPECPTRGNVGHQKRRFAVHSAILLRAAAERREVPVEAVCAEVSENWARRAG